MPVISKHEKLVFNPNEFDFETQLLEFGLYLVLGKPRSGKTTVSRLISQHLKSRNVAQAVVIAGNQKIKKDWAEIVHPMYIHDGFSLEPDAKGKDKSAQVAIAALDQIIKEQQGREALCDAEGCAFPKEWELNLFIDDCGSMETFMRSAPMKWISNNRRQIHCTVFINIQKFTQAWTSTREAADGVICLQTGCADTIKGLHKGYVSTIPFHAFETVLCGATENRGFLVINCHPERHILEHMLFFGHTDFLHKDGYKARLEKIGSPELWADAEKKYKPPVAQLTRKQLQIVESITPEKQLEDSDQEEEQPKEPVIPHFTGQSFAQGAMTVHFHRRAAAAG